MHVLYPRNQSCLYVILTCSVCVVQGGGDQWDMEAVDAAEVMIVQWVSDAANSCRR